MIHKIFHPDTDPNTGPVDPLASLEKSTDAQKHMTNIQIPRLEALQTASDHYSADPYSQSLRARKRFRQEKKVSREKEALDTKIKDTYALPEGLSLVEDSEEMRKEAKETWLKGRQEIREREPKRRKNITTSIEVAPIAPPRSSGSLRVPKSCEDLSTRAISTSSLRARILENTARHRGLTSASLNSKKSSYIISGLRR